MVDVNKETLIVDHPTRDNTLWLFRREGLKKDELNSL
jgi:hypothetical protein